MFTEYLGKSCITAGWVPCQGNKRQQSRSKYNTTQRKLVAYPLIIRDARNMDRVEPSIDNTVPYCIIYEPSDGACESVGVTQKHVLNNHFRTSTWVNLVTPVCKFGRLRNYCVKQSALSSFCNLPSGSE